MLEMLSVSYNCGDKTERASLLQQVTSFKIIFSINLLDPEYPLKEMYKPYRNLLIRAYDYPIETRLDMKYVNECVLPELKPKMLIIPKEYASRSPSSNDVPISYVRFDISHLFK
jgi:hypothetical protein